MDISSIIYAAIGGAVGGSAGALLSRFIGSIKENKALRAGITALCVVGCYTLATSLYKNMYLPRIGSSALAEIDEAIPYLSHIREQSPQVYAEMIQPIDRMTRNKQLTQEGLNEFRSKLQEVVAFKKKTASAETLKYENTISIELFNILKEKAPHVCTQKFYGQPYERLDKILDDDYGDKETLGFSKYFTDPPRDTAFEANLAEGETLFNDIIQDSIQELGITELEPSIDDVDGNKKICDLQITINTETNALSDTQFLNIMSYINSVS